MASESELSLFHEVIKNWQNNYIGLTTSYTGPPVYDKTVKTNYPNTFEIIIKNKKNSSKYTLPLEFKTLFNNNNFLCQLCDYDGRVDRKLRNPVPATGICIMNGGRFFRPVCDECQKYGLFAHNNLSCIQGYVKFDQLV